MSSSELLENVNKKRPFLAFMYSAEPMSTTFRPGSKRSPDVAQTQTTRLKRICTDPHSRFIIQSSWHPNKKTRRAGEAWTLPQV